MAGVDLLEGKQGPLLLEVNSSPGLEGIEVASELNVAAKVIAHVIETAGQPEVRIEELLRSKPGHGVLSFDVSLYPWHIGSTLGELIHKPARTQPVCSLDRSGDHIWRPRTNIKLRAGDRLILYGELKPLRRMLAELRKRPEED